MTNIQNPEDLRKLEIPTAKLSVYPMEAKYHLASGSHKMESVPYKVQIRNPHGNTYAAAFDSFYSDLHGGGDISGEAVNEKHNQLATPESEFMLGQVEMRFVPITESGVRN